MTAQRFPPSPLSDLAGSVSGADLDRPVPRLCCEGHGPFGPGRAEPDAGSRSAASRSRAGRAGLLIAWRCRSQTVLLPRACVSNYQHIFLYLFKRLAGTLPSVYKKHSLTFIFPLSISRSCFPSCFRVRADIQTNSYTQSRGSQPAPFIKWFCEAMRRAISM